MLMFNMSRSAKKHLKYLSLQQVWPKEAFYKLLKAGFEHHCYELYEYIEVVTVD